MNQVIKEEISAGGVVYRKNGQSYEFLLGKHSGYHKWVLPKGHIEPGETQLETAVREVEEELGVKAKIVNETPIKTIEYYFTADLDDSGTTTRTVKSYQEQGGMGTKIHKKVIFYLMEVVDDGCQPEADPSPRLVSPGLRPQAEEMSESKWVSYEEGMMILAFETEREVFSEAGKVLKCL